MHDLGDRLVAELPRLRRYARALVGHREGADDLVQDTLERAWQKRSLWRPQGPEGEIRPWLLRIMHNRLIDHYRRPGIITVALEAEHLNLGMRASQDDALALRDLARALESLSLPQREILLLVGMEALPYERIAEILEIPVGTVMSRLSRARENLRLALDHPKPASRERKSHAPRP